MSYPQVVRVFATTQKPDYDCPWQAERPSKATGSGVFIAPDKVLTGAHVVANATFLQVKMISSPNKVVARVEAICHDSDLALLTVEDEQFLEQVVPAELGQLPQQRDKVSVVGFPVGGEEISITEGVVSRVEVQRYSHSQRFLLAATVDAAINKGNSGGPVFKDGKVVGIAFQKLSKAENIGEMVPTPLIRTFLSGVAGPAAEQKERAGYFGTATKFQMPWLGIKTQILENPAMRQRMKLDDAISGVLVCSVEYGSSCWGELQPHDILLEIDGLSISNSGTVQYRGRYRTRYDAPLCTFKVGDEIRLKIQRDGQVQDLPIKLKPCCFLVPRSQYNIKPTYFIYGGLVFQPLTRNFLATWNKWWDKAPAEFLTAYYGGRRTKERQEIVVLAQVLSDEINIGYESFYYESVKELNGVCPHNMEDFIARIEESNGVVEIKTSRDSRIIFDTGSVRERGPHILERYQILRDRSSNLPGTPILPGPPSDLRR